MNLPPSTSQVLGLERTPSHLANLSLSFQFTDGNSKLYFFVETESHYVDLALPESYLPLPPECWD